MRVVHAPWGVAALDRPRGDLHLVFPISTPQEVAREAAHRVLWPWSHQRRWLVAALVLFASVLGVGGVHATATGSAAVGLPLLAVAFTLAAFAAPICELLVMSRASGEVREATKEALVIGGDGGPVACELLQAARTVISVAHLLGPNATLMAHTLLERVDPCDGDDVLRTAHALSRLAAAARTHPHRES